MHDAVIGIGVAGIPDIADVAHAVQDPIFWVMLGLMVFAFTAPLWMSRLPGAKRVN